MYFHIILLTFATLLASCVKDDLYNGPANINAVSFSPSSVTPDDAITVSATVTALRGIENVRLVYHVNGQGAIALPMVAGDSNVYKAVIPKQADHTDIEFYVEATTNGGITAQSTPQTFRVGAIPPNYAAVTLNEVDGNKKFVELYNNSDAAVNISGMMIIKNTVSLKNEDGSPNWAVPAGTVLPAHSFGIIKCSGYTATPPGTALIIGAVGDGMSAKQTLLLELTKPDGTTVNSFQRGNAPWGVTISAIAVTDSYSRCPDGTGSWKTAVSSAGLSNNAAGGDIPPL
jgi:hypothetical protein